MQRAIIANLDYPFDVAKRICLIMVMTTELQQWGKQPYIEQK
jgi:hypothetical protein